MPFKKIVIADWLKNIAESMGEKAYYVPNAFDFSEFGMDIRPEDRKDRKVMMLYNDLEFKRQHIRTYCIQKTEKRIQ
ncbi:MAG: hypothetical protein R2942_09310 [Ignavibacteria bacterium]